MERLPWKNVAPTNQHDDRDASEESSADDGGTSGVLHRRNFLKLGVAVGALGTFGATSARGATTVDIVEEGADPNGNDPIDGVLESVVDDGVVVEFPSDGEFVMNGTTLEANNFELRGNGARLYPEGGFIRIEGSGWAMDGFEVDMRSDDTYPTALFGTGDWTVSRCIWRGQAGTADSYAVIPEFADGTTGAFVDCYWPDGAVDGGDASNFGCIGSFSNNANSGHLRFERCWFHGWSEDTSYLSESSGSVELVDCFYHNTIVGPRVSDVTLRRVKSVHDGSIPVEGWSGSSFQSGVWLNGEKGVSGQPVIEDCDFYIAGPAGAPPVKADEMPGGTTVRNTRIHAEDVPQAIRMGDNQSVDHDITLDNVTLSGVTDTVLDGNVLQNDVSTSDSQATDATPNIPAPPSDGSVPGQDGSTNDGSTSDSGSSTDDSTTSDGDWRTIRITGDGDSTTQAVFEFTVSGDLESLTPEEPSSQDGHGVDGSSVTEDVWSSYEEYRFTGDITAFSLDGPATVSIDGEPASLIRIEGDGDSTTQAVFEFTVSGDLDSLTAEEPSSQDGHGVDGSSVTEDVWSGYEEYMFTGDVTSFSLDGPATVFIDGTQVDAADVVGSSSGSDSGSETVAPPTVDRYEVTEAGSKNPHANVLVEWDVSSSDSDLATGVVEVVAADGSVAGSSETAISGSVHYGTDYFEMKNVDGRTFDIVLTVENEAGKTATATQTVTE